MIFIIYLGQFNFFFNILKIIFLTTRKICITIYYKYKLIETNFNWKYIIHIATVGHTHKLTRTHTKVVQLSNKANNNNNTITTVVRFFFGKRIETCFYFGTSSCTVSLLSRNKTGFTIRTMTGIILKRHI